jgi:putative tryptophan/tyrosine transport system substrate-binding protein
MRRREFIKLFSSTVAAWPLTAGAQQAAMPVIGYLGVTSINEQPQRLAGFQQGLAEAGFIEGKNLLIEYRWAEGHFDRFPALAAELVKRQVVVIAVLGTVAGAVAAKAATTTIPIVFVVGDDPTAIGLVASFNQPGGNATGIYLLIGELQAKRLGILRELLPAATRVAVLVNNPGTNFATVILRELEAASRTMGIQIQVFNAGSSEQINDVFAKLAGDRPDALFVVPDAFFNGRRSQLAILAARYGIPATYPAPDFAEVGGLISYGPDITDAFRQGGNYTGRILKGAKAADLPVVQPTKFELVINLQTAKALGIEVPASLLARADKVIE